MRVNIIGDIHGRKSWKKLIVDDAINVFVGDYFSAYHNDIYPYESIKENFMDIINFKKENPKTVLLIGNHDEDHWHWCYPGEYNSGCSRHDFMNEREIKKLFEENKNLFQAAYGEGNLLITHAGVGIKWLNKYLKTDKKIHSHLFHDLSSLDSEYKTLKEALSLIFNGENFDGDLAFWNNDFYKYEKEKDEWIKFEMNPKEVSEIINKTWKKNPESFDFSNNASSFDYYGTSDTHGPMWIRYEGIQYVNIFRGSDKYIQVYGHTISDDIKYYSSEKIDDYENKIKFDLSHHGKMIMVDCLECISKSLMVELDDNNGEIINIFENKLDNYEI